MSILFKTSNKILNKNLRELLYNLLKEDIINNLQFVELLNDYENKEDKLLYKLFLIQQEFFCNFKNEQKYFCIFKNLNELIKTSRKIKLNEYNSVPSLCKSYSSSRIISNFHLNIKKVCFTLKKNHSTKLGHSNDNIWKLESDNGIIKSLMLPDMKIVIKGNPGVGKTTHYRKLTYLWASKLLREDAEKLLLNISLSTKNNYDDIYDLIVKQNFKEFPLITRDFIKLLFGYESSSIILFIDDADSEDTNISLDDLKFIFKEKITCVIWSRDNNVIQEKFRNYESYELLGLNPNQLEKSLLVCYKEEEIIIKQFVEQLFRPSEDNYASLIFPNNILRPSVGFYLYELFRNEKKFPDVINVYEIYTEKIKEILKDKNWLKTNFARELGNACLVNLANPLVKIKCNPQTLQSLKENLREITNIFPSTDSSVLIEFSNRKFQEFFAANFLVQIFNDERYDYLLKIPKRYLKCVIKFVKIIDVIIFELLLEQLHDDNDFEEVTRNTLNVKNQSSLINLNSIRFHEPFSIEISFENLLDNFITGIFMENCYFPDLNCLRKFLVNEVHLVSFCVYETRFTKRECKDFLKTLQIPLVDKELLPYKTSTQRKFSSHETTLRFQHIRFYKLENFLNILYEFKPTLKKVEFSYTFYSENVIFSFYEIQDIGFIKSVYLHKKTTSAKKANEKLKGNKFLKFADIITYLQEKYRRGDVTKISIKFHKIPIFHNNIFQLTMEIMFEVLPHQKFKLLEIKIAKNSGSKFLQDSFMVSLKKLFI